MNHKKEKYRKFSRENPEIPIFSKGFWLDAACGKENWDVILIEKGGRIFASMPYYLKNNRIKMPKLTQTLGPWIWYSENMKYSSKISREKKMMTRLINELEELEVKNYNQNFHLSISNWQPFYWKGFNQTTRYTYIIDDLQDTDLNKLYDGRTRTAIRKAYSNEIKIVETEDLEIFYKINRLSFERQNISIPYSYKFLQNIDKKLRNQNKRKIFLAIDNRGKCHSALYLVWDNLSSYLLLKGDDYNYRESGAGVLIIDFAIKFTKDNLKLSKFDFEGSMIEGVARNNRSFGAKQYRYFNISKDYKESLLRIIAKDIYNKYDLPKKIHSKIRGI